MNTLSLSTFLIAGCLAAAASAQTPTLVNGQKVLVDRNGRIIPTVVQTTLPPAPLVGGADSCVTPDVIAGLGSFPFDNTTASTGTQGQTEAICLAFATTGISNDVWFTWTAPYTGSLRMETCGGATQDTKLAAYAGASCPTGSALACNDDTCNLQSRITFPVTSGNSYVLQLGNFPGGTATVGTFMLIQPPPPPVDDNCATPTLVVGSGPFAYDNTYATTGSQGQSEGLCLSGGLTTIGADEWFTWVATFSGTARVSTCGGTTADTKIAAYSGSGCPSAGSALACNDNGCGAQSQADFPVTQGNTYTLQIGAYPTVQGAPGSFTINQFVPSPIDDCQMPAVLAGPGTYMFDSSIATDSPQQSGTCPNAHKDLWYTYAATTSGTATITTCGLITSTDNDTVIAVYAGAGCPTSGSIACNDDACGLQTTVNWPTVCGNTYTIQVGVYSTVYNVMGSFNITESGTQCGPTGVPFCFGDGSGSTCPCGNNGAAGNGCASSVNPNGAHLTTSGNSNLANDTLVLQGTGMPSSSCLYFQGTTQISSAFGDGLRCAGGTVIRLGTKTNVSGSSQYPTGADASVSVKGAVTVPGTRTYQTWYRNAAPYCTPSTFNLTNGILVTWQ